MRQDALSQRFIILTSILCAMILCLTKLAVVGQFQSAGNVMFFE